MNHNKSKKLWAHFIALPGIVLGLAGIIIAAGWLDGLLLSFISFWKGRPITSEWHDKLHILGFELLAGGAVLFFIGLIGQNWTWIISWCKKEYSLLIIPFLAIVIFWLPIVFIGHSTVIGGTRYWWLGDDAMISMRYAQNLANGYGLVWNLGERVEGYTNFLWTLYMSLLHLLPIPISRISLVVLLSNVTIIIATLPIVTRLTYLLGGNDIAVIGSLIAFVLSEDIAFWATDGFETALLSFFFLLSTYRVIRETGSKRPNALTFFIIGVMSLVRADAIVLSALLYALALALNSNKKLVLIYSISSLAFFIAQEVFRIYYYKDFLPNTAFLKVTNWNGRLNAGLAYVMDFAKHYSIMIGFAVVGSIASGRFITNYLVGIFSLYALYVAGVGGDAFQNFRFFVPALPLLIILSFLGAQFLSQKILSLMGHSFKSPIFITWFNVICSVSCLATIPLIVPNYANLIKPNSVDVGNVKIGLLLKQNTSATSKVADFWAGSVFYFSGRYGIDMLGKSDRYIAHLPAVVSNGVPGHNKFDFDYSIGILRPDFVIANFKLPVTKDEMVQASTGDWAFTGQLYLNPVFQQHCLPNPIRVNSWRTIFVCDWSNELKNRKNWDISFTR